MAEVAATKPLRSDSRDRPARMRALVDAAVELFAAEGYANVSTRRIAERAGCSETLLFRYFGGKRGLLLAISDEFIDATPERRLEASPYAQLADFLQDYVLDVWQTMQRRANASRVIIAELITDPGLAAEFEKLHDTTIVRLEGELGRFQDSGEIAPDVNLRAVAVGLEGLAFSLAFVEGIIYRWDRKQVAVIAEVMARLLARGLGHPGPGGGAPAASRERERGLALVRDAVNALQGALPMLAATDTEDDRES